MNKRRVETGTPDAVRSGEGLEAVQAYLPWILGGAGVLLVGAIAWGLISSASEQKAAKAWGDYYFNLSGNDSDTFLDLAEDHPGTAAADWAILTAGAGYLEKGLGSIYVNKSEGETQIKLAIEQFEKVSSSGNSQLRAKALMGLAQANESLGNVEEAAGFYEEVSKVASQPRILAMAGERRSFLTSESGKEFYAWFKKQDPKPDPAIELPADLANPPSGPDLEFSEPAEVAPEDLPEVPNLDSGSGDPLPAEVPALEPGTGADSQPEQPSESGSAEK
ncbi:MAG: hypothetical protein Aurels2KO_20400 [Aureliella sp.]